MKFNLLGLLITLALSSAPISKAFSATGLSYYPQEQMNEIMSGRLSSDEIKDVLFDILSEEHEIQPNGEQKLVRGCSGSNCFRHQKLGYKQARQYLFGQLHLEGDQFTGYQVQGVYCQKNFKNGSAGRIGPGRIPNSNVLNCEHTWPQSKFQGFHSKSMQKGDLHHLFPTDSRINSMRGNYPFGEVDYEKESYCNSAKFGGNNRDHSDYYFEPPTEHKGNVARALFYFSVRYQIRISSLQEFYLKKWHAEDPVDEAERMRNDQVEEIQFNRNPFVDMPHLVSQIKDF